jgi:hypothetical protein
MHKRLGGDTFAYFEVSSLEANDNLLATDTFLGVFPM